MKTRRTFLTSAAAGVGGAALAQDDGAKALWDGKSLEGWHLPPEKIGHGTGGRWIIENGVLTGEQDPPGSGNGGLLLSNEKFGDFELTLEMNPDWGPDSGVFFRCNDLGHGFQMYVDHHDRGNVGHLRGEMPGAFAVMPFKFNAAELDDDGKPTRFEMIPDPRVANWPEGVYERVCKPEAWLEAWKVSGWNTAKIRCVGKYPQITTWINGLEACHFNGETCTLPGYDKERVFELLGREGSIALQVHGGKAWPKGAKVRWRNLRIKHL